MTFSQRGLRKQFELRELCCEIMSLHERGEADACGFDGRYEEEAIVSCMRVAFSMVLSMRGLGALLMHGNYFSHTK